MNRSFCSLTVLILTFFPSFADVNINTTIKKVFRLGSRELAGRMEIDFDDDLYKDASPGEPIYLRTSFLEQEQLGETLVDLTSNDPAINRPIFLAMALSSSSPTTAELVAPADTAAIVRLVAGEPYIWIRFQRSASEWLSDNGVLMAPNGSLRVLLRLGLSARASSEWVAGFSETHRNLPFNTRDPETQGSPSDASSSLIIMDFSSRPLDPRGFLRFEILSFDYTAQVSPGVYLGTSPLFPSFLILYVNALGRDRSCVISEVVGKQPLKPNSPQPESGLSAASTRLHFNLNCDFPDQLEVNLVNGAWLQLETDAAKGVGFEPGYAHFSSSNHGLISPGIEVVDPLSAFTSNGHTLYSRLFLYWDSGEVPVVDLDIQAESRVVFPNSPEVVNPEISWSWSFLNHEQAEDVAPFNGPDQHAHAEPVIFEAGSGLHQPVLNIPTLGQWGLLLFCTLLVCAGLWFMRRKRLAIG